MTVQKGDVVYWARVHHETGIYEVCELKVRTVYANGLFVGVDVDSKQAFILNTENFGNTIFEARVLAVNVVNEEKKSAKEFTIDKGED